METIIRAIIVDDEAGSRAALRMMIQKFCEGVQVCGEANNVETAVALLKTEKPDIVFLDIEMPEGNGFNLFYQFETIDFEVIFTTAYSQYAIKALRMAALDYLLKPIDVYELEKALNRFRDKSSKKGSTITDPRFQLIPHNSSNQPKRIAIPIQEGYKLVDLADVVRLQADGSYTLFVLQDGTQYMASRNLKEYEDLISDNTNFIRVHRSHIINKEFVEKIIRSKPPIIEMSDGMQVSISSNRKDQILKELLL